MALVLQAAGIGLRYLTQVVLARWLGPVGFGAYAYAMNLGQLVASPCDLGAATSGIRFVPQYVTTGDRDRLYGVVRLFTAVPVVLGALAAVAGVAVVAGFGSGPTGGSVLLVTLALVPVFALSEVMAALIRGFRDLVGAYFPTLVLQPVLVASAVGGVALASGDRVSALDAVALTAGAWVATVAVQAAWLRRRLRPLTTASRPLYDTREWARVSFPLLAMNTVQLVFQRVDVLVVGLLLGAKQAGIYTVAFRTAGLASIFQTAMNAAVAPRIGHLFWGERRAELEGAVLRAVRRIFPPSLAVTVALVVLGRPLLSIFGEPFVAGWAAMAVYAAGQLASVSAGPVGWLMNLTGHQGKSAWITAATAALALAGYLVLVPVLGIVGAALANAAAVLVKNVWMSAMVRRHLGLRISLVRALRGGPDVPRLPEPPEGTPGTT